MSINPCGPTNTVNTGCGNDTVHISKADGLAGLLGLYEVNINGQKQYMTEAQLKNTQFNLGGGNDTLWVDSDVKVGIHANGGSGNDVMVGGSGNDDLHGGSGNDAIFGRGGNDHVDGGAGRDLLSGGNGRDHIDGGTGNDRIYGGNGNDVVHAGSGNDYVNGGNGNDALYGQNVGMAVVLRDTRDDTLRGLHRFMTERLAEPKMPVKWFVLDEIPRTSRGKVNRDLVKGACTSATPLDLTRVLQVKSS